MSTHNIGFYEDLTKIMFELSSNTHLISSAALLSQCKHLHIPEVYCYSGNHFTNLFAHELNILTKHLHMSLVLRKPVFGVSGLVRHKPGCAVTEGGKRLEISYI